MYLLGVPYEVVAVTTDSEQYDRPAAQLIRSDGVAGNVTISGYGVYELKVGKTYRINEVEPTNGA